MTQSPPVGQKKRQPRWLRVLPELTVQHKMMLVFVAEGYNNDEISHLMFLPVGRLRHEIRVLLHHFGARNRAHLVALAYRSGAVKPPRIKS